MQGIKDRWNDIKNTTKISLTQFLEAIDLVIDFCALRVLSSMVGSTKIYGSSMGSPLSPILADIIMDDLEINCLTKLDFKIHNYYRYIDDIFLIIPRNKVDSILKIFNEYHPRLKFTHKLENNNFLRFLNTSVIRGGDGKL